MAMNRGRATASTDELGQGKEPLETPWYGPVNRSGLTQRARRYAYRRRHTWTRLPEFYRKLYGPHESDWPELADDVHHLRSLEHVAFKDRFIAAIACHFYYELGHTGIQCPTAKWEYDEYFRLLEENASVSDEWEPDEDPNWQSDEDWWTLQYCPRKEDRGLQLGDHGTITNCPLTVTGCKASASVSS